MGMTASGWLLLPDPGEPTPGRATPAPVEPNWVDQAMEHASRHPLATAIAASTLITLTFIGARRRRARRKASDPLRIDGSFGRKALVFVAAGVGSGFTIYSMWRVFEHQLHISNPALRGVLCGVFEIAMLSSALNSRAFRIRHAAEQADEGKRRAEMLKGDANATFPADDRKPVDVDGIVAWIIGLLSGVFCALDATNPVERGIRFVLPLLVVWMWERAIASDLRTFTRGTNRRKIVLRVSLERVLVALRIADSTGRGVDDVDRARYRSAFTIAAFHLHNLTGTKAAGLRVTYARWRLRRAGIAIMKRFGVDELTAARTDVATLYGIEKETGPEAVKDLTPWRPKLVIDGSVTNAVTSPGGALAVTRDVTPTKPSPVMPSPRAAVTGASNATLVPSPRRDVTPSPAPKVTATGALVGDAPVAVTRVRPLSRDVIDAQFLSWTAGQVEEYAAERAQHVLTETGNKTAGMREYFLTCLALGVEPKGSAMAKAVGASGGLGRGKAIEWHGELAVDDAEMVLRDALARVTAERAAGGDGHE